jgi:rubrerythrin
VSDKPSYLGLLNSISQSESTAHCLLTEWAGVTKDPAVREVLLMVAAREGEHAMTFARRVNELGYEISQRPQENAEQDLDIVRSDCSDLEKMEKALGLTEVDTTAEPDIFENYFGDHSIDIRTGELLGRFIAEERDSERRLRRCYESLRETSTPRETAKPKTR